MKLAIDFGWIHLPCAYVERVSESAFVKFYGYIKILGATVHKSLPQSFACNKHNAVA